MTADTRQRRSGVGRSRRQPRRGLVLGAGGVLGFTWSVAALRALEDEFDFDAREVESCLGTSAGAILAALLGCGVTSDVLLRHQLGRPGPEDPAISWDYDTDPGAALPKMPAFGMGSPRLALRVMRHPRRVTPLTALSAVLPPGRGSLAAVTRMVDEFIATLGCPWPERPAVRVVATDYGRGRRVVFGSDGAPRASLAEAVTASCAIPGWYPPVEINGRPYVDGGTCSPTSVDLLARSGLDEVYVVAPMASLSYDHPRSLASRVERRFRRANTRRMLREVARVRAAGTRVTLLTPGPADLEAIGANVMDAARRRTVLTTAMRSTVMMLQDGRASAADESGAS